jgi:hypothetical protein
VCAASCNGQHVPSSQGADGCEHLPAAVKCCITAASQQLPSSGSMGDCTSPTGARGTCRRTSDCSLSSFPSRLGAVGCGHIPAADVQCCAPNSGGVVSPPNNNGGNGGSVSPVNPSGACQLARPDSSCGAFTGRTLTVNVRFIDEVQRIHAHARAAGVSIYITDSFRNANAGYGAGTSRHKAGFALDMNAGGCNADCMCRVPTRVGTVTTFLRRVMADSTLHWGGDPRNPIMWRVGSCSRDSVHIQSTRYEAGSNYQAEVSCLGREASAGRFRSFSCPSIAALNDDAAFANLEQFNAEDGTSAEGLTDGETAGVAIGVIIAIALACAVVVFFVVRRRQGPLGDDIVSPNGIYMQPSPGNSANFDTSGIAAGMSTTYAAPGQYACASCGKTYSNADDLSTHTQLRHP